MLKLLLKTRLRYHRNYLKHHFDRITVIEIGAIFLIFLLLLLRSPADMGYRLNWLASTEFPAQWAKIFSMLLPIFYLLFEFFAWLTFKPTTEWHIIVTLPFERKAIANYFLIRHVSKVSPFIFLGSITFFGGLDEWSIKLLRFLAGLGLLITLLLVSFKQAQNIRNPHQQHFWGRVQWAIIEIFTIGLLLLFTPTIRNAFSEQFNFKLFGLLPLWIVAATIYIIIKNKFTPHFIESKSLQKFVFGTTTKFSLLAAKVKGPKSAMIFRDLIILWRYRRSSYFLFMTETLILLLVCFFIKEAVAAYITLVSLQFIFGLLLNKTVIILFQQDVDGYDLMRTLPVKASSFWWSRWSFIFGFLSLQMLLPILVLPLKFVVTMGFVTFMLSGLFAIPAILAIIYCNAGFCLFPHISLFGYIVMLSIILIILFWFFMPFGSLIILAVMIFWIRRSQKRFQYLELM